MKMSKLCLALVLLIPAAAMGQEKYTNADLNFPPRTDAYTNADLDKLEPLKAQTAPIVRLEAVRLAPVDEWTQRRAAYKADLNVERSLIEAEIAWWESVIETAHSGLTSGPNEWPHVGGDTGEARMRIKMLERNLYMLDAEASLLR